MQNDNFQRQFGNLAKQSTRDYVGITLQKTLPIAFPRDIEEQKLISRILDSVIDHIASIDQQFLKLQRLKIGLMQDLLTGKVSVAPLLEKEQELLSR